jgi:hypothetical protein
MKVDFSGLLQELFPPGVCDDLDKHSETLLRIIGDEFSTAYAALLAVVKAIPDGPEGVLWHHWQDITRSSQPMAALTVKGVNTPEGFQVSNTRGHFHKLWGGSRASLFRCGSKSGGSLATFYSIRWEKNCLTIGGIPNHRSSSFRAGSRSGKVLATFNRDEEMIMACERVRHAHTFVNYEVQHASH